MTRTGGTILVLAFLAPACGDVTAPGLRAGLYPLASIDGQGPPFVVWDTVFPTGERWQVTVADTFEFLSESAFRRARFLQTTRFYADGSLDSLFGYQSDVGEYEIRRDTVLARYPGRDLPPSTLAIEEDGVLLRRDLRTVWCFAGQPCNPPLADYRYQRQP